MQVGVIGCGKWGGNHARTLAELSALGGVADLSAEKRCALAAELGCRAYGAEALLADPSVGAMVIALPPAVQAGMALRAIGAGKHLLVEKPMALDAATARQITGAANAAGLVAMTGHLLLFHPAWRALCDLVAQGALGSLRHIHTMRLGQGRFYPGTDVVWDLLPHDLSLLRDLMGSLPARGDMLATAVVSELADTASLHMAWPGGGPVAHCAVSRVAPVQVRQVLVQGSRASLLWDEAEEWPRRLRLQTNPAPGAPAPEPCFVPLEPAQPLTEQLRHFLAAIEGSAATRGTAAGGHDVLRFIHALHPAPATDGAQHDRTTERS